MNKLIYFSSVSIFSLIFLSAFAYGQAVPDTGFVYIPANTGFVFSTDVTNTAATGETAPINSPYVLCKTLVTNAQYKAFCTATNRAKPGYWLGGTFPTGKGNHPVLQVSLTDAQAYCNWLSTQYSGYTFRVPTEAELENAARGPNKTMYPWGNSAGITYSNGVLTSLLNYNGVCSAYYLANYGSVLATYNNSNSTLYNTSAAINTIISISSTGNVTNWINHTNYTGFVYTNTFDAMVDTGGHTTPVYTYPGGKCYYGCYDMGGNAFEWASTTIIAQNGAESGQIVNAVRGGSWYSTANSAKTSYRGEGRAASGKFATVGFRVGATAASVLPLQLLRFTGVYTNGQNLLTWKTIAEINTTRFVIERSIDSRSFDSIGVVSSSRTSGSTSNTYYFSDTRPAGNNYYRLKMVDRDGTVTYSFVVVVANEVAASPQLFYQAESGLIKFTGLTDAGKYSLLIYNSMGQVVSKIATIVNGQEVSLNTLVHGIYQIAVLENGKQAVLKRVIC